MPKSRRETKYIFVTGGVLSGVGKGITAASIGNILKARGFKVNLQKCDPYINTDAGTLNPAEHGEVFVTADGAETDLDLGHYERFLDQELTAKSSLMSGTILSQVIADERAGKYLGKTVQIIPHITNAIQDAIQDAAKGFDFHIVEIGGTVGDFEGLAFLEAIRALRYRVGAANVLYVNVVYLPFLAASKEVKTKPAQNAVRTLRENGIAPDVLIARSESAVHEKIIHKLSMYCDVPTAGIIPLVTANSVYRVPLMLEAAGLADFMLQKLGLPRRRARMSDWRQLVKTATNEALPKLKIGVVAKYMDHEDTYMSVFEAAKAAAWHSGFQAELVWIDAEKLEVAKNLRLLDKVDGLIVPGGFGSRGVEGKIKAATYAMKNKIPYLGLCLGMQVAVVALARQVLGPDCHSTEIDTKTKHPVISLMPDQAKVTDKGGTMRLGNYVCVFDLRSKSRKLYSSDQVSERHRHRYEFNNEYRQVLSQHGLRLAGLSPDGRLVELIELDQHPFFIASQFHPEFKSRPTRPHPLFDGFIKAVAERSQPAKRRLAVQIGKYEVEFGL